MLLGKIVPSVGPGNTAPSIHLLILALYKSIACLHHMLPHLSFFFNFWVTVCKTLRCMLSDHCVSVCPVLSVCNIGVLCPNDWMDWDETWHGGRPRPWPHCAAAPPQKGHSPQFSAHVCCGCSWLQLHQLPTDFHRSVTARLSSKFLNSHWRPHHPPPLQ